MSEPLRAVQAWLSLDQSSLQIANHVFTDRNKWLQ